MPLMEGFHWDYLRKILHGSQRMAKVANGKEILPEVSTPLLGRTNIIDDRLICNGKDQNEM